MSLSERHRWIKHFNRVERRTSTPDHSGAREAASRPVNAASARPGRGGSGDPVDVTRGEEVLPGQLPNIVNRTLVAAREQLGMDLAFVSEFTEGRMAFHALEGDAESFNLVEDVGVPLDSTFCQRMVDGRLPNVVPDAHRDEIVKDLEVTRDSNIGSYIGVPLRFSSGRLYGTMCCLSHAPNPSLQQRDAELLGLLARLVSDQLEQEEREARQQRLRIQEASVHALLAALDARDDYTGEHSQAVVALSSEVARRLGLSREEVEEIERVALLHDVGKIGVPDSILNKPGPLDEQESKIMWEHPEIGERIVASIESLAHLAPCIRAEHERWDGSGYPDGLSAEQIPLPSRIALACDAFHAMISDRPYRKAMGFAEATEELKRNAGTQFCPSVVPALAEVVSGSRNGSKTRVYA